MTRPEFVILRRWRWMDRLVGMRLAFNLFGPFLGAGIRVARIASDHSEVMVELQERWYNRNIVGAHFGGSLYSMCDPIFMFMLMKRLGSDFIVWDRAATIDFVKPGIGTVRATFTLDADRLAEIRAAVEQHRKTDAHFDVDVTDSQGGLVARVHKVVYVRRRARPNSTSHSSN